jgi:hypothetical protein
MRKYVIPFSRFFSHFLSMQNIDPDTGFKSKRANASRDRKPLQVIFQKAADPCEAPLQLPHPSLDAASRKHQRENIENVSRFNSDAHTKIALKFVCAGSA